MAFWKERVAEVEMLIEMRMGKGIQVKLTNVGDPGRRRHRSISRGGPEGGWFTKLSVFRMLEFPAKF